MICPLSPAAIFGFGAFHIYAAFLLFDSRLAPLPLLTGMRALRREVKAAQTVLGRFGIVPLARLIGKAGTGIFTLAIARKCREVVAIDISGGMLEILQQKAEKERLDNIQTKLGNAETMDLAGTYSLADLPAFFKRLARHLEPGGRGCGSRRTAAGKSKRCSRAP